MFYDEEMNFVFKGNHVDEDRYKNAYDKMGIFLSGLKAGNQSVDVEKLMSVIEDFRDETTIATVAQELDKERRMFAVAVVNFIKDYPHLKNYVLELLGGK